MDKNLAFANHGEVIKMLYKAFGVLPRKNALGDDGLDDTAKKRVQQVLNRLAKEEGKLQGNLAGAHKRLAYILAGYFPLPIMEPIIEVLNDLLDGYAHFVSNEGTFLNREQSLRYAISIKAVPIAVDSLYFHLHWFSLVAVDLDMPDDPYWFLPSFEEGKDGRTTITYPLGKALEWAYQLCETSQTQFHYPGKSAQTDSPELVQNLENAINWKKGRALPALPALRKNLLLSFTKMDEAGRPVPPQKITAIFTVVVIARVTTYLATEINKHFGTAYLQELCQQFRTYADWRRIETDEFLRQVLPVVTAVPGEEQARWQHACMHHHRFLKKKQMDAAKEYIAHCNSTGQLPPEDAVTKLANRLGDYAVRVLHDLNQRQQGYHPPAEFIEMLGLGMELKKAAKTEWKQIDDYAATLAEHGQENVLNWLEQWIRGAYHHHREQWDNALPYYRKAFKLAKYRAGGEQHNLVRQYLTAAAKTQKKVDFKQGVEWARIMGIKVFWLPADEELTDENIAMAMAVFEEVTFAKPL